jgi:hypothetical protein
MEEERTIGSISVELISAGADRGSLFPMEVEN